MKTEIINIGDELLIGQVVNTNASWMAEKLNLSGFATDKIMVIGDDEEAIYNSLNEASKYDLVLITGGLGPTKDDITKKVFCRFFNSDLVLSKEVLEDIERLWGAPASPLNRQQAEVPEACIPLRNKNGTAPGMWFEKDGCVMISLPGVPFEMKGLMEDEVIPRLKKKFATPAIIHKTILTQGVGESFLSEKIESWELSLPKNIRLAYLPQPGIVRLRLTGTGNDEESLKNQINGEAEKLRSIISEYIFGEDNDLLEEIIGKLLISKKATLSVAESCTGGYISHLITSISGSSEYYKGGITSYANEIKENGLGVNPESLRQFGAVSEQVVKEMAEGARKKFGTTYSVATSGIAGPTGGTDEKPVGLTFIAVATPEGVEAWRFQFSQNRERNIRRASLQALNLLRKKIIGG